MIIAITIVILLACVVLGFFVLIQNPKGGGLAGQFGTLGTQVMGVKQSTDVMEKGTWATMGIIAALAIISVSFYPKIDDRDVDAPRNAPAQGQQQAPAGGGAPAPAGGGAAPSAPAAPAQ